MRHNDRTEEHEPKYLLPKEYREKNEVDLSAKDAEAKMQFLYSEAKENHVKHTGQKLQATSYKWEAVVNLNKNHTLEDVQKLTKDLEKETGFTSVQIAIHRDEGRVEKDKQGKDVPIHNYHAHITFFTLDRETGVNLYRKDITKKDKNKIEKYILEKNKNIEKGEAKSKERKEFNKLVKEEVKRRGLKVFDRERLSKIQTLTANSLDMERGKVSVKKEAELLGKELDKNPAKHLGHKEYRQKEKELVKVKELKDAFAKAKQELQDSKAQRGDYAKFEQLKKELDQERKDKNLTKEKLELALKEITDLKKVEKENIELKKELIDKKDELKKYDKEYKELKAEHSKLKENYVKLKDFIKDLPNKIIENTKKAYKEVLEKVYELKKEEKEIKAQGTQKKLAELYEKREELKQAKINEKER